MLVSERVCNVTVCLCNLSSNLFDPFCCVELLRREVYPYVFSGLRQQYLALFCVKDLVCKQ